MKTIAPIRLIYGPKEFREALRKKNPEAQALLAHRHFLLIKRAKEWVVPLSSDLAEILPKMGCTHVDREGNRIRSDVHMRRLLTSSEEVSLTAFGACRLEEHLGLRPPERASVDEARSLTAAISSLADRPLWNDDLVEGALPK